MLENRIYKLIMSMEDLGLDLDFFEAEDVIYKFDKGVLTFEVSSGLEDEDGYAYLVGVQFEITSTTAFMRNGYADGWLSQLNWEKEGEILPDSPELEALRKECF